ncbi:unnamed protein product [Angiostrongylus costaricensis]|uniref:Uncharacterized protein n=1 Tax=Angiostrongylus costaricensis TaxID=334426 RepID=A0A0R3PJY6_ANGCS|nr:unnamed protein product [Angiostrongylus costaricensis]
MPCVGSGLDVDIGNLTGNDDVVGVGSELVWLHLYWRPKWESPRCVPSAGTVPHDITAPLLLTQHSENNALPIADVQCTLYENNLLF